MALRARYAFEDGYEPDDAPVLNGMAERKSGCGWAPMCCGAALADLGAEWLADASGHSRASACACPRNGWRMGSWA
jgi:outer membrane protein